jgi:cyanate permease
VNQNSGFVIARVGPLIVGPFIDREKMLKYSSQGVAQSTGNHA